MQRANEGSGDYEVNFNDENEREFRRYQNQRPDLIIQVNAASTINYPPPIKFSKDVNVHDWIKEVELYIELTGVRDKNKTVFWAYLDADTRKLLSDIVFDEEDGIATVQIKRRLVELFGQRQKGTLDLIKEFSERKQRLGERIYCRENLLSRTANVVQASVYRLPQSREVHHRPIHRGCRQQTITIKSVVK